MKYEFSSKAFLKRVERLSRSSNEASVDTDNELKESNLWQQGLENEEIWAILNAEKFAPGNATYPKSVGQSPVKTRAEKVKEVASRRKKPIKTKKGPRVVAVDDDLGSLDLLESCLEDLDAIFTGIPNARKALKFLNDNKDTDIIIADYDLNDATGIQLINSLSSIGMEATPVIFISGYSEPDLIKKAASKGVKRWMVKPFDPIELQNIVEELSLKKEEENASQPQTQNDE